MTRKLATIRKIAEIKSIPDADRIVAYRVDGWWVVDSVGKYQIGDLVCYLEVDSWVPHTLAPFLSKGNEPREFENVKGERLRTIRLKGQLSQGLLLPLTPADKEYFGEGEDVTEDFGILKWEAPIPAELSGDVKGSFPGMIPKTDQERCLPPEALVKTPDGEKEIQNIKVGDYVVSFDHESNVQCESIVSDVIISSETTDWLEITTEDGNTLVVTPNHQVFLPELGCYREAGLLQLGDFLQKV